MTPEAALRKALTSVHPFDEATAVPEDVKLAMKLVVERGCDYVHNKRVEVLKWMSMRAEQLEYEEKVHDSLSSEAKKVVEGWWES